MHNNPPSPLPLPPKKNIIVELLEKEGFLFFIKKDKLKNKGQHLHSYHT